MKYFLIFVFITCSILWIIFPKINTDSAIDAIVGEASNQSYDTMVCVAQGIRHRGNLKGVYGLHAKHNGSESSDTYEFAEQAWSDSLATRDRIKGAKNWGSLDDLQKMYKKGQMPRKILAKCGDLYFY